MHRNHDSLGIGIGTTLGEMGGGGGTDCTIILEKLQKFPLKSGGMPSSLLGPLPSPPAPILKNEKTEVGSSISVIIE